MLPNPKLSPLRFGTSGVRALVTDMTDMECYINTRGFIRYLYTIKEIKPGDSIVLGGDLRSSTPRIISAVHKAILDEECQTIYCGFVPTPTLSYYAWKRHLPAIMITGSHIPEDRNGIKFIKSKEEVLKNDEKDILFQVAIVRKEENLRNENESLFDIDGFFKQSINLPSESEEQNVLSEFKKRYTDIFPPNTLTGKKIVLYEQSAVGRDVFKSILTSLGAEVISFGRSDKFIPIDTEEMSNAVISSLKQLAQEFKPFAIVSTDGDSDRPILTDENGSFLSGERLCALVSLYLKPDFASMTATCGDDKTLITLLKKSNIEVVLTKIGSPYVIFAMNEKLAKNSNTKVVSWERNGGYLTGSNFTINNKILDALPTRDSILPLLIALVFAKEEGVPLSVLINKKLSNRFSSSSSVNNKTKGCEPYTVELGKKIISSFSLKDPNIEEFDFSFKNINQEAKNIKSKLEPYFNPTFYGSIISLGYLDGVRISFSNGDVVHFRPSSNAPEFRFYITSDTKERADKILADCFVIIPKMIADIN